MPLLRLDDVSGPGVHEMNFEDLFRISGVDQMDNDAPWDAFDPLSAADIGFIGIPGLGDLPEELMFPDFPAPTTEAGVIASSATAAVNSNISHMIKAALCSAGLSVADETFDTAFGNVCVKFVDYAVHSSARELTRDVVREIHRICVY